MALQLSRILGKRKGGNIAPRQYDGCVFSSPAREKYFTEYIPLHKAALSGDWEAAESLLNGNDNELVRTPITLGGETALHMAAVEGHLPFVSKLLENMNDTDVAIQNKSGSTALSFAAVTGHSDIAELLVRQNDNLHTIPGRNGITPLYLAALQGHVRTADYLFSLPGFESWDIENQIALLTTCIDSGLYDLAKRIVGKNERLVGMGDSNEETPLEVLARTTSAFCCTGQNGWWPRIANTIKSFMKLKKDPEEASKCDAYELFDFLWNKMICQQDIETGNFNENISRLFFIAAQTGNDNFVVELIHRYPDFLHEKNNSKHSIFHIAVSQRYVQVFNLIYELRGLKDLVTTYIDDDGNNILHLAAKLGPEERRKCIPGEALQMQREVLWYKEVEKIVHPSYVKKKNLAGQTPYELFLKAHEDLMKQGEKMMKQIAKSCMLVAMLITTVVFAAAFTVPGGYDNRLGTPILLKKKSFVVFPISEAVATLSSLTSVFMFLSILTSRYTEMDFLNSLPFYMVTGVAALFVSIVAMMVAFCCCLLFYQPGLTAVIILPVSFTSIPIMFLFLNYPLLITILRCSFGGRWLFRSNNRLFT